jgi:Outer membrane protein beta-barrel domain
VGPFFVPVAPQITPPGPFGELLNCKDFWRYKLKRHIFFSCFTCLFGISTLAYSQATPTASKAGILQVGVGGTIVIPDYAPAKDKGPTFYASYDFTSHLGVEGDIHFASIIAPDDVGEDTYLIGPRYVINHKRFSPYAKVLFGIGQLNLQFDTSPHSKTSYFAYALGAGLDVRATRSINVRAFDFEYQEWSYQHGLNPLAMTIGVAYVFH